MNASAIPQPLLGKAYTIMLVDDAPVSLKVLQDDFAKRGFTVAMVTSGEEALAQVETVQPDLILLDIIMPGIDGLETCRRLKADEATRDIPVIFMSSLSEISDLVSGFEMGGVDYVTKPFQTAEVMARVSTHLNFHTMRQKLAAEIKVRHQAEQALQLAKDELERRVEQRTEELAQSVDRLKKEVAQRTQMEVFRTGQSCMLEMIAKSAPLTETLDSLVQLIESLTDGMQGSILLLDGDGIHVKHGAAPSLPASFCQAIESLSIGPNVGSCGAAMYRREAVYVSDIQLDPLWVEYRDLAIRHGLRACWSTPIFAHDGLVLGAFAMYYRKPCTPSPDDILLIELATHNAGIAIERKRAEQALAESEARFRSLVGLSSDEYWEQDEQFRFVSSPLWGRWMSSGLKSEEFIGKKRWEVNGIIGVSEAEWTAHRSILEAHQPFRQFEYGIVDPQGEVHYASINGEPVFDADGRFHGYRGTSQDITVRKKIEAALKQTLLEQQAILDNTVVGILFVKDRIIQRCNRGFEQLLGWEPDELMGRSTREIYLSDDDFEANGAKVYPLISAGQVSVGDIQLARKDGSPIWCFYHGKAIDPDEPAKGTVWAALDISSRKEAESALADAKAKLEEGMIELELRNREVMLLGDLSSMLQSCLTAEEAYRAMGRFGAQLFPGDAGALFILERGHQSTMKMMTEWNEPVGIDPEFIPSDCWALRCGRPHRVDKLGPAVRCAHAGPASTGKPSTLCVPLIAQSEIMGLLHLQTRSLEDAATADAKQSLAIALAEQAALALASIRLRLAILNRSDNVE